MRPTIEEGPMVKRLMLASSLISIVFSTPTDSIQDLELDSKWGQDLFLGGTQSVKPRKESENRAKIRF